MYIVILKSFIEITDLNNDTIYFEYISAVSQEPVVIL